MDFPRIQRLRPSGFNIGGDLMPTARPVGDDITDHALAGGR